MVKGNRFLAGLVLALLLIGGLSGAVAIAEEGADETTLSTEAPAEEAGVQPSEEMVAEIEASPPAEEPAEADAVESVDDRDDAGSGEREPRPRPARNRDGGRAAAAGASAQPPEEGQGTIEIDPESAAGACPGGTAFKIDNLRSNGTFGPITISDYTNTSFTWTSTEAVSAVLVKDGGGHKTNPGGSSGSASTFGQDISHVIFCLGGDVPDVDAETPEEPCDADETMPGTQECDPPPCDADESMPGTQECDPPPCDADETMPGTQECDPPPCDGEENVPGTQQCVPPPCDADETMPGTQECVPAPCDADDEMPGRQDCVEEVAGVESEPEPEKSADDQVQGAGLAADRGPDVTPMAAQPMAAQTVPEGGTLPFTGGQVLPLLMVAAGLVTAGGGAILIRRP